MATSNAAAPIPPSALEPWRTPRDRVRERFSFSVNDRIDRQALGRIRNSIHQGPQAISRRIERLDAEWDIDRALLALFPVLGGATLAAALTRSRKWFFLL